MVKEKNAKNILKERFIYRIIGVWGTTFLGPLTSSNALQGLLDIGINFPESVIMSALSATITIGLIFFNEIKEYGEAKL